MPRKGFRKTQRTVGREEEVLDGHRSHSLPVPPPHLLLGRPLPRSGPDSCAARLSAATSGQARNLTHEQELGSRLKNKPPAAHPKQGHPAAERRDPALTPLLMRGATRRSEEVLISGRQWQAVPDGYPPTSAPPPPPHHPDLVNPDRDDHKYAFACLPSLHISRRWPHNLLCNFRLFSETETINTFSLFAQCIAPIQNQATPFNRIDCSFGLKFMLVHKLHACLRFFFVVKIH